MSADFKIGCGSVVFREYELERVLDAIYLRRLPLL